MKLFIFRLFLILKKLCRVKNSFPQLILWVIFRSTKAVAMAMTDSGEYQVLLLQEGTDLVAVSRAGQLVDSIFTTMEFRLSHVQANYKVREEIS